MASMEIDEAQDDGSHLSVAIEVSGSKLVIDLTQAPIQSPLPINLSKDGTMLACQMALMGLIGDRQLANGGCFRVLDVKTRSGSIYDVQAPGPCGIYFETMIRLNDLIWRCLAEKVTDTLPSGNSLQFAPPLWEESTLIQDCTTPLLSPKLVVGEPEMALMVPMLCFAPCMAIRLTAQQKLLKLATA